MPCNLFSFEIISVCFSRASSTNPIRDVIFLHSAYLVNVSYGSFSLQIREALHYFVVSVQKAPESLAEPVDFSWFFWSSCSSFSIKPKSRVARILVGNINLHFNSHLVYGGESAEIIARKIACNAVSGCRC